MLTEHQKKYLITIYHLGQNGESVRTTDISSYLHVTKPSTVSMLNKLSEEGLIMKEPNRQIKLTKKGITEANEIFTSSVILQNFFVSKVRISSDKAAEASMLLSSGLDADTLDKIVCFALSENQ